VRISIHKLILCFLGLLKINKKNKIKKVESYMDLIEPITSLGLDYLKPGHGPKSPGYWVNPSGQVEFNNFGL
jgi:hypothetical protein